MHSNENQIVIVGGGLIGLLSAWYLSRAKQRVVVIDRSRPGFESSWAGAGVLSPLYPDRYPAISGLVKYSQEEYPPLAHELTRTTGINPELQMCKLLVLDEDRDSQAKKGTYPSAHIRSPRLLQALKRTLAIKGVEFIDNCEMTAVEAKNGRLAGLRTNNGLLRTRRCIVAAGAWAGKLLETTGLALPIIPIKGQLIVFKSVPGLVPDVVVRDYKYIVERKDGCTLVGSTLENTGFNKDITKPAFQELYKAAVDFFPAIADYPVEHHWAGLRPGSPDDCPFIATHPDIRGLVVCAGHYRNGFATGPASARLAVDLLQNGSPNLDPTPFRLDRPLPRWSDVLRMDLTHC